jgi:L-methionine (R)-S-oxide reductase
MSGMDGDLARRIAATVAAPGPRRERAHAAANLIRRATGQRWVGIYTVDDVSVTNEAWSGPGPPAYPSFPRDRGLTAHALLANAPALSNDVANDPRYLANQDDSGSELILPVIQQGHTVGTLDVESDKVGAFDGELLTYLERCAAALVALWDDEASQTLSTPQVAAKDATPSPPITAMSRRGRSPRS